MPWEVNQRFSDINGFGRLDNMGDTDTEDMEPDAQDGLVPRQSSKRGRDDTPTVSVKQPKAGARDQPTTRPTDPPVSPMDPPPRTDVAVTASVDKAGAGFSGESETAVMLNVKPQLNLFTETHTHVLPLRFGCSFNHVNTNMTANILKIRMNAPYDILGRTTFTQQTEAALTANGVATFQAIANTGTNPTNFANFETTLIPATAPTVVTLGTSGAGVVADANCKPGYRTWYEKLYESYHVIETQYRITFVNPETEVGRRVRVYEEHDVFTASNSSNIMPSGASPFSLNALFREVKTHIVTERNNNDDRTWVKVIEGTWRPGVWSKNVKNDEDIKTWYTTGAGPDPLWIEELVLTVRPDEYMTTFANLNCFVELRYVVQFKNPRQTVRYMQPLDTAFNLVIPTDVLQVPNTRVDWGNSA